MTDEAHRALEDHIEKMEDAIKALLRQVHPPTIQSGAYHNLGDASQCTNALCAQAIAALGEDKR